MAIRYGTVLNSTIKEDLNDIRRNRKSKVSSRVRKWRTNHPNAFRDGPIYCKYTIKKPH